MKAGQRGIRQHSTLGASAPSRDRRRLAVLAVPAAVPLSMSAVFAALCARLRPNVAYNAGFFLYWLG
jgi:hypothetical protein